MYYQDDDDLHAERDRKQREFGDLIDINGIDGVADWIFTKKTHVERDRINEAKMIQAVNGDFDKVCIDSGAGESVCPVDAFPAYGTFTTGKNGVKYRAAGGQELVNVGEKRPRFTTNGVKTSMTFQATTGVRKPLAAASNATAKGNRIILDDANSESYIENKATGVRIPIKLENGIYMMEISVAEPPFTRPATK